MNYHTNQKGFAIITLIVLVVILAGITGYFLLNQTVSVSLGQQFTLKQGQIAKITNTDLEIKITAFYNDPCKGVCGWSGVGIGFEYRFNGEIKKGIDSVQAFGHQTTIVETDHKTYANLIVEKMK